MYAWTLSYVYVWYVWYVCEVIMKYIGGFNTKKVKYW